MLGMFEYFHFKNSNNYAAHLHPNEWLYSPIFEKYSLYFSFLIFNNDKEG